MGLRDKTNVNALKDKFIKESKDGGKSGKGNDKRFLNYFDMKTGDKMTIRLLPDGNDSGEYWYEYSTHGSKLKIRGLESISCAYTSSGEECPACQKFFDLYEDGDKEEAKRWGKKQTFLGQCLVVDSPVEVNESDDGNPVKLVYLPFGIIEIIKEAIIEGHIDDPLDYDFVIKKTENNGGYAEYSKSYFDRDKNPLPDEILEAFESGEYVLHDLSKEAPEPSTTEQVEEWLEKAEEKDAKKKKRGNASSGSSKRSQRNDDDGDKDEKEDNGEDDSGGTSKTSASSLMDRLKKNK